MPPPALRIDIVHRTETPTDDAIYRRQDRLEAVLNDHDDTLSSLIDRIAAAELSIDAFRRDLANQPVPHADKTLQSLIERISVIETDLAALDHRTRPRTP
ncbi:hypothetical protein ES703_92340 [subsurface metagenome]